MNEFWDHKEGVEMMFEDMESVKIIKRKESMKKVRARRTNKGDTEGLVRQDEN